MTFNNQSDPIEEMFDRAGPLWSEEEIAKLFELNPEVDTSDAKSQVENEVLIDTSSPSVNLVDEEEAEKSGITAKDLIESEENPHDNPTQPTFASNPFAKLGAVGLMMAVLFGVGAVFVNGVISTPIGRATSSTAEPTDEPIATQSDTEGSQNEIGELKTQLALGRQSQQLEDWSQRRRQSVPTGAESPGTDGEPDTPEPQDLPEPEVTSIAPRPSSPPPPVSRPSPAPPPVSRPSSPPAASAPPPARVVEPVLSQNRIKPIIQPTPEPIREPEPIIQPIPEPVREPEPILQLERVPVPAEIDPMQQYALLGALGSYGRMPVPEISHLDEFPEVASVHTFPVAERVQSSSGGVQPLAEEENILAAAPSNIKPLAEEQNILAAAPTNIKLLAEEQNILLAAVNPVMQVANAATDRGITAWAKDVPSSLAVKSSSFQETPTHNSPNRLQIGRLLGGELLTSLWANPAEGSSELFVVKLTETLTSTDGQVLFPPGTQVIFETTAIASNGVVEATAVALVDGLQEYRLPPGILSIQGKGGQPLIARQQSASEEGMANRDARTFAVGALARVGDALSQPDVIEQFSSSGGFSSTQYSRSQRRGGWQSITGAALSGGFGALSQRLEQRERLALQELDRQSPLWVVESGTPVTLFVHGTFEFAR